MEDKMVDRLAQRFVEEMIYTTGTNPQADKRDYTITYFFINAIADEILLQAVAPGRPLEEKQVFEHVANWLHP